MEKNKVTPANVLAYISGKFRYKLYYSRYKFLIRTHIREQIDFRIKVMDKECYEKGECVICGCSTTALQMSKKSCDKPCYPTLMSRRDWDKFYYGEHFITQKKYSWCFYNIGSKRKVLFGINNSTNEVIKKTLDAKF